MSLQSDGPSRSNKPNTRSSVNRKNKHLTNLYRSQKNTPAIIDPKRSPSTTPQFRNLNRTAFPFNVGDKHPDGFLHNFGFQKKVYLSDEMIEAQVVDETAQFVRILDGVNPKARLKAKRNDVPM